MGTEKRERQKANRRERQLAEQRAERVSTVKRNVVRGVVLAIAAIAAVVVIAWVGGAFDGDEETTATTPPTTDVATTTTPQFETPEKPEVDPPDEIPTELVVTTLVGGEGPEAAVGDVVTVHYVGIRSEDGLEFDNSYDRGQPFSVQLGVGQVIPGWDQGLLGVQAGEQRRLDIPADLAYGDTGSGPDIRPGDALTFVVDVLAVDAGASQ